MKNREVREIAEPEVVIEEVNLRDYFLLFWQRKWVVILILLGAILSSVVYIYHTKSLFEAKVIMVSEKVSPVSMAVLNQANPLASLEIDIGVQQVLLTSPDIMDDIRDKLSDEKNGMPELTDEEMKGLLKLSSPVASRVIELTAEGPNPYQAFSLANAAAEAFIEMGTEHKRGGIERAITFLTSQMENFDQLLEETEKELARFKEGEGIVPTVSGEGKIVGGLLQKLGAMQEDTIRTEIEIGYIKAQLDSVRQFIADKRQSLAPEDAQGVTFTPQIEVLRNRLIQIETNLFAKQQVLTDEHPNIVALKEQVNVVQAQLQSELGKLLQATEKSLDPISEWRSLLSQEIQFELKFRGLEGRKKLQDARIIQFRKDHPELLSQDFQLLKLERKRRLYEQSYLSMEGRRSEMNLLKQMRISDMRIIKSAEGAKLIKPRMKLTLGVSVVFGLVMGLSAAVFFEHLDNTVKSERDVQHLVKRPVIGVIPEYGSNRVKEEKLLEVFPVIKEKKGKSRRYALQRYKERWMLKSRMLANLDAKNPMVEAHRLIMGSMRYAGNGDSAAKVILLTSAMSGDGKSLTTANLAMTYARGGMRTVVVDADLHHGKQHIILDVDRSNGLSDLCSAEPDQVEKMIDSIVQKTDTENLFVVSAGNSPPNPGDLLMRPCINDLVKYLRKNYDIVFFDSPPLGVVSDASVIAPYMDTCVLLVRAGDTKKPMLQQVVNILQNVGIKIFGVIINGANQKGGRYGYYYGYSYSKHNDYYSSITH